MTNEKIEPEPNPEDRGQPPGGAPEPQPEPGGASAEEPGAERVEEVEATPMGEGEKASGPTIDAPPSGTGGGSGGGSGGGADAPGRTYLWPTLTHLAGLASIPFLYVGGIVGPLIVWQLKEAEEPSLAHHGREAINFQLNMLVWTLLSTALAIVLGSLPVPCCCTIWALPFFVQAYNIAFTIIAAVRASEGEVYRYPAILRLL